MIRFAREPVAARCGGALLMAVVLVTVVSILSMALLQLTAATTKRQASAIDANLAFYLAEAGLAEAYSGITLGLSGGIPKALLWYRSQSGKRRLLLS